MMMIRKDTKSRWVNYPLVGVLATFFAFQPAYADDPQWRYSTGIDVSSGDYGNSEDTDILYVPVTMQRTSGDWTLKATIPWVSIDGPGVVGGGDAVIVVPGVETFDESGLGDVWLTATYAVSDFPAAWGYLDLSGKAKIPTADEDKGLGTGEADYTAQADFFKPVGKWMPMASLAYKSKGEPDGVELDDVWYLSLGSAYQLSETTRVGASLDFQQASAPGSDDSQEVVGFLTQRFSSAWQLTLYGYLGMSDGSPDQGFGVQVSYRQR